MVDSSWKIDGFTLDNPPYNYYPDFSLEPKHMKLDLSIDIKNQTVAGTNTITVISNSKDARSLKLDAIDFDELTVLNQGVEWEYDGEFLDITLQNALPKGESLDIEIKYKVERPISGLYFSYPDEKYPNRPIYAGSDHESERARYWIPAVDHPSVRTSYEFILTSEADYTILAIGKLLSEETEDGKKTVHWKHDFPCPTYIAAIALGELTEFVDRSVNAGNGEIPVAYYTSSNYSEENLKLAFDRTPEMIEWFVDKFKVPFAWDKYYQFSFLRIFGAMENQSLVSWSDFAILNERTHKEMGLIVDDVNVHEMAHTYFGDMVVIKNWSHAWLKESWATYCTALYREDKLSKFHFDSDMYDNAQSYFSETNSYVRPIVNNKYHSSWEMFDRHLYPGGAWRLHMLRKILGDDVFFEAVTDYLNTYTGKTVETIDFQRKLEEHSGKSLGEFFDQWVQHPKGFPELSLSFSYDKEKQKGKFSITQKQIKSKDPNDVRNRPFNFDIDLAWYINDKLHSQTVSLSNKFHEFSMSMEKPDYVTLDPEHKVLFKLDSKLNDNMYHKMLENADYFTRVNAIKKLVDSGKRKNITKVVESYDNQEFYDFKIQIIKALASSNSRFAVEPLIDISQKETHPMILRIIPQNMSKYKDERIEKALLDFVNRDDLNPYAKESAIASLSSQTDATRSVYESYLERENWKYTERIGAFRALAGSRDSKYLDTFIDAIQYGNQPEVIRRSIIFQLGSYGNWLNKNDKKRLVEALEELLRDEYGEVRSAVFSVLVRLEAKQSISKMKKIFGLHPKQSLVSFNKQLKRLRSKPGEGSKLSDLVERVEKLESSLQKLDEKLQKLEN